jgi:hypothetical protein
MAILAARFTSWPGSSVVGRYLGEANGSIAPK